MKIKKGDNIMMRHGKDRKKTGKVIATDNKKGFVTVEKLNLFKKHVKPTQSRPGSIITLERAVPVSKVMLICPACEKKTKVSYAKEAGKPKQRICKKCKAVI